MQYFRIAFQISLQTRQNYIYYRRKKNLIPASHTPLKIFFFMAKQNNNNFKDSESARFKSIFRGHCKVILYNPTCHVACKQVINV